MTKKLFILVILFMVAVPAFAETIVDTAWVRRYNGPGDNFHDDNPYAITVDGSGNVYVTGYSYGSGTDQDYATIKYYPNGDTAWVRRYNGPGNSSDGACAITLDDSGNVYVTGISAGSVSWADYATIKYFPNGDTAWVRRYNGPVNGDDGAYAIVVDRSGNVYVTGWSGGSGTEHDYATIKYLPNGDTAWVRRYNGPGNSSDGARAITLDDSGNVYVTGISASSVSWADYATIKYFPNGDTAWVRRYNGPGNNSDYAFAIAVDGSGNVYVNGESWGDGTYQDYATIKYYPNGDTAWVRRYDSGTGSDMAAKTIVLDGSNNIYVTGTSGMGCTTIKYYPNGDTAWLRSYKEPGSGYNDGASAMTVDDSGNIYITGCSGQFQSPYVYYDCLTIKYYSNGDTAWVRKYSGPGMNDDYANAIAVDGTGNVYVTGQSVGSGTGSDYATIKYFQALRGDVNRDGTIDVGDVVFLINYLFRYGPSPDPLQTGNTNCVGGVDVGDVVVLINYLFKGGAEPSC